MRAVIVLGLSVLALVGTGCKKEKRSAGNEEGVATPDKAEAKMVEGVSDEEVKIGMVGMFTGTLAQYGMEMWRGAQAHFVEVNAKGGVNGRQVRLVAKDDGYDPARTVVVMKAMLTEEDPFMLFNQLGTGPTAATLPMLVEYKPKGMMVFANYSGAQKSREAPYLEQFFHIRASYAAEAKEQVEVMLAAGKKKIGIYYQEDPYGKSVLDGIKQALTARQLTPALEVPYKTGQKFEESTVDAVKKLKAAGCDAIVMGAVYQPAAAFVRDAREMGWNVPVAINSIATDTMLRYMSAYEAKNNKVISTNIIWTSIVPNHEDTTVPIVREYREMVDKRNPRTPPELTDPNYRPLPYSFSALEGYVDARVFTEVLAKAGPKPTRASFKAAAESTTAFDPGLGAKVDLSGHEGLKTVWAVGAKNGVFVTLSGKDVKAYLDESAAPAAAAGAPKAVAKH